MHFFGCLHNVRHKFKSSTPFYKERKNLRKGQLFSLYPLQIFPFLYVNFFFLFFLRCLVPDLTCNQLSMRATGFSSNHIVHWFPATFSLRFIDAADAGHVGACFIAWFVVGFILTFIVQTSFVALGGWLKAHNWCNPIKFADI